MADFKPIATQEELDAIISERIRAETEKFADYDALKEKAGQYDGLQQEMETLKQELKTGRQTVSSLEKRAETAENTLLRLKVAHANNIPFEMAERLKGSTEEELTADAQTLSKFVTPPTPPAVAPLASTEPSGVTAHTADAALVQMAASLGVN